MLLLLCRDKGDYSGLFSSPSQKKERKERQHRKHSNFYIHLVDLFDDKTMSGKIDCTFRILNSGGDIHNFLHAIGVNCQSTGVLSLIAGDLLMLV